MNVEIKILSPELINDYIALKEGYNFIEAYPTIGEISTRSYHGPYSIYEKFGFSLHKNLDDIAIVRKHL